LSVERITTAPRGLCLLLFTAGAAVAGVAGTAAGAPPRASSALTAAPSAQVMVVGAGNVILSQPRGISTAAVTLRVSGRNCTVSAATPLAALADLRRVGGPGFSMRDYGRCGSSPRSSGQLFVYSIDGETSHGQNGWEYKVNSRSGTTGAGDTSGAQGDGRLLGDGSRVLWFWCESFGGGCQRTLEVSVPGSVSRGGSLPVRVIGYDNEGRGIAMSGARVSIAGSSAVTDSSGRVILRAPSAPGYYGVRASRPGSVPSFPGLVRVR
jgi:hypothetical protein